MQNAYFDFKVNFAGEWQAKMNLSITMDLSDFNSDTEECWQVLQEGI